MGKAEGGSGACPPWLSGCRVPWLRPMLSPGTCADVVLGGMGLAPHPHAGAVGLWSAPWAAGRRKAPSCSAEALRHGDGARAHPAIPATGAARECSPSRPRSEGLDGARGKEGAGQHLPGRVSPSGSAPSVCPVRPGRLGAWGEGFASPAGTAPEGRGVTSWVMGHQGPSGAESVPQEKEPWCHRVIRGHGLGGERGG